MVTTNTDIKQQPRLVSSNKFVAGLLIFVIIIMLALTLVFYHYFDVNLNAPMKNWLDTAVYFNNLFSPFLLFVTAFLIFVTWWHNKIEFRRLYKQNEKQQESDNARATFSAISPMIETAIKDIYNQDKTVEICHKHSVIDGPNEIALKEREAAETVADINELLRYRAKIFINRKLKYNADIGLPRAIFMPICNKERILLKTLHDCAKEVTTKEKKRKYRIPKSRADKSKHIEYCAEQTIQSLELQERIQEYNLSSKVSFVEYSDLRFDTSTLEAEVSNADYLSLQSTSFNKAMESIEYIADLMSLLRDQRPEKTVLSKFIYKTLGQYQIYTFLELTYERAYSTSEHAPFAAYFRNCFEEITKVLLVNEYINHTEYLYACRLDTKWNHGIIEKIDEIANSLY